MRPNSRKNSTERHWQTYKYINRQLCYLWTCLLKTNKLTFVYKQTKKLLLLLLTHLTVETKSRRPENAIIENVRRQSEANQGKAKQSSAAKTHRNRYGWSEASLFISVANWHWQLTLAYRITVPLILKLSDGAPNRFFETLKYWKSDQKTSFKHFCE